MNIVSNFAERFNKALKIRNMKQSDIVELTGIGKSSISTYLTGEYEPKQKNTYKIAKALNVSEPWLMGYDVPMNSDSLAKEVKLLEEIEKIIGRSVTEQDADLVTKIINQSNNPNQYAYDLFDSLSSENQMNTVSYMRALKLVNKQNKPRIQILGQTAAGQPIEYGDTYAQDINDVENIPKGADYALVVNGDSMEPTIKNGQTIYIRKTPDVENGSIAVVEVDGAVTCKKVYKWADHIELQSINTTYEPMIITGGNFRILGEVILPD